MNCISKSISSNRIINKETKMNLHSCQSFVCAYKIKDRDIHLGFSLELKLYLDLNLNAGNNRKLRRKEKKEKKRETNRPSSWAKTFTTGPKLLTSLWPDTSHPPAHSFSSPPHCPSGQSPAFHLQLDPRTPEPSPSLRLCRNEHRSMCT